jgi:hypothetical protein
VVGRWEEGAGEYAVEVVWAVVVWRVWGGGMGIVWISGLAVFAVSGVMMRTACIGTASLGMAFIMAFTFCYEGARRSRKHISRR